MSRIEWTERTWNPTTGCDRVSPGCGRPRWSGDEPHGTCYALTMAARLKGMGQTKYQVDGDRRTSGPGFGITEHPDVLDEPLRRRKPTVYFTNSMSDLFHRGVSDDFIARVWAVMALARRHTFQVLTKRHGRMRSLLGRQEFQDSVEEHATDLIATTPAEFGWRIDTGGWTSRATDGGRAWAPPWPLPNVWVGVSVEDQARADLRVGALLGTPAAVRFLSCEPLLGPVDLRLATPDADARARDGADAGRPAALAAARLDWVIAGGESGPGSRPLHPDWARDLRDQCQIAGVPFFFKQRGDWTWSDTADMDDLPRGAVYVARSDGRIGTDADVLAKDGGWQGVWRVGKKRAGRELDGRTHDGQPIAESGLPRGAGPR